MIGPRNPVCEALHALKYRQRGETFDDYCVRYARTTADDEGHFRKLLGGLRSQAILPAGRQQRAVGWPFQTTAFNCFVGDTVPDDTRGIGDALTDAMLTLRSGGGCGWDFSPLRPRGEPVRSLGDDAYASGPVSFMGIWHAMCNTIRSAGERRGAMMGVLRVDHPDILEFIRAKTNEKALTNFNISVGVTHEFMAAVEADALFPLKFEGRTLKTVRALDLWSVIMENNWDWAEPGVLFLDTINGMNPLYYCEQINATNPCVVGETLIAVAGRGAVPIRQLAEEGKDIPVYAVDRTTGETVVKWGRKPRLTGRNVPLVKVTLDDGSTIRCTPDHSFPLRDGRKVEAKDLKAGDSLYRIDTTIQANGEVYVDGRREYHRIAEAKYGRKFDFGTAPEQYQVHHLDEDHFNNSWENIEVLTSSDHSRLHRLGDNNPMRWWWAGLSEEARSVYRRTMSAATTGAANGMWGRTHSTDTKAKIGAKTAERSADPVYAAKHAAAVKAAMTEEVCEKIRASRKTMFQTFNKTCEHCKAGFTVRAASLETESGRRRFCSLRCATTHRNKAGKGKKLSEAHREAGKGKPHSAEHNARVAASLRKRYAKKEEEAPVNHKVVSVEPDGFGDVYNLTVDDVHTYGVYTTVAERKKGTSTYQTLSGVKVCNCGEQPLPPRGACLLLSLNCVKYLVPSYSRKTVDAAGRTQYRRGYDFDLDAFAADADTSVRACDNVFENTVFPLAGYRDEAFAKRRMGVGVTGVANALEVMGYRYGTPGYLKLQDKILQVLRDTAYRTSIAMARVKGSFPLFDADRWLASGFAKTLPDDIRADIKKHGLRNGLLLSIAPTGTISLTADNVSSGIEPPPVLEADRTIQYADGPRKVAFNDYALEEYGVRGLTSDEVPPLTHVKVLCAAQRWVDSSISKTINLAGAHATHPKPGETSFAEFKDVYMAAFKGGAKGCTTYNRNGKRAGIIVAREPSPDAAPVLDPSASLLGTAEGVEQDRGDYGTQETPSAVPSLTLNSAALAPKGGPGAGGAGDPRKGAARTGPDGGLPRVEGMEEMCFIDPVTGRRVCG